MTHHRSNATALFNVSFLWLSDPNLVLRVDEVRAHGFRGREGFGQVGFGQMGFEQVGFGQIRFGQLG